MKYTAYGYANGAVSMYLGFVGQLLLGPFYMLGNGYRVYSVGLMRFVSPDVFSPFDIGGLNSYAYCEGDPVNFVDPSGRGKMPKLRLARADRPNPPAEEMPQLVREPNPLYQGENIKRWSKKKQEQWTARTDVAAMRRDRRARTYEKVGANDFSDYAKGAQSITRVERAQLQSYVDSDNTLVNLTVPESRNLRGLVLDSMVSEDGSVLGLGVVTQAVRGFFDTLPNRNRYTQGDLHNVLESARGAILRRRKSMR